MCESAQFGSSPAPLFVLLNAGRVSSRGKFSMSRVLRVRAKLLVLCPVLAAFFGCAMLGTPVNGQAVAETAGATSVSATAASSMKPATIPKFPAAAAGAASSPHLVASSGPPAEEANRRTLEARAGKDAGKLLLRATPVEAQIWIDGKIVGKTPILLVLAPRKYEIEMRGARGETAKNTVDLLPRETRELPMKLHLLYPGRVRAAQP
jgi:hypothetical protein